MAFDLVARLRLQDNMTNGLRRATQSAQQLSNAAQRITQTTRQTTQSTTQLTSSIVRTTQGLSQAQIQAGYYIDRAGRLRAANGRWASSQSGVTSAVHGSTSAIQGSNGAFANAQIKGVSLIGTLGRLAAAYIGVAGAQKLIKETVGGAMRLEQEQISMEHFIGLTDKKGAKKKTDEFLAYLRKNANETPFETNEVISAGRRAVNVTNGQIDEAKKILIVAENMAALNPGKTVMDAMEALADMKNGETERMKEFGFKISQKDLKAAGGGDVQKGAMSMMTGKVAQTFDGGAMKLGKSGAGYISTITGSITSGLTDMGVKSLEIIKPQLEKMANFMSGDGMNNFIKAGSDALAGFFTGLIEVGKWVAKHKDDFVKMFQVIGSGFKVMGQAIAILMPSFVKLMSFIADHLDVITQIGGAILIFISTIAGVQKGIAIFNKLKIVVQGFFAFMSANPIVLIIAAIAAAVYLIYKNWDKLAPYVQKMWAVVKPILLQLGAKLLEIWQKVKAYVIPIINEVVTFIRGQIDKFKTWWNANGKQISEGWGNAWKMIKAIVYNTLVVIWGNIRAAFEIIKAIISIAWAVIEGVFRTVWETLKVIIDTGLQVIRDVILFFSQLFTGDFKGAWETIKRIVGTLLNGIWKTITTIFENVNKSVAKVWDKIKESVGKAVTNIWDIIKDTWGNLSDGLKKPFTEAFDYISGLFESLGKWIDKTLGKMDLAGEKKKKLEVTNYGDNGYTEFRANGEHGVPHRFGRSYIGYDNYPALLHEGERVLTKSENKAFTSGRYGSGSSSISFGDIHISGASGNVEEMADQFMTVITKRLQEAGNLGAGN